MNKNSEFLKKCIMLHISLSSGYSTDLCHCMMKSVDIIDAFYDNRIDAASSDIQDMSLSILSNILVHIKNYAAKANKNDVVESLKIPNSVLANNDLEFEAKRVILVESVVASLERLNFQQHIKFIKD